jgi:hypothetical protein
MTKIDTTQLSKEIKNIKYHQKLWRVLKYEIGLLGYWRNKPRGNPSKGYKKSRKIDGKEY